MPLALADCLDDHLEPGHRDDTVEIDGDSCDLHWCERKPPFGGPRNECSCDAYVLPVRIPLRGSEPRCVEQLASAGADTVTGR